MGCTSERIGNDDHRVDATFPDSRPNVAEATEASAGVGYSKQEAAAAKRNNSADGRTAAQVVEQKGGLDFVVLNHLRTLVPTRVQMILPMRSSRAAGGKRHVALLVHHLLSVQRV